LEGSADLIEGGKFVTQIPPNDQDDDQPVGRVLTRREVLGLLSGMSAAVIVGAGLPRLALAQTATVTPGPTGTSTPAACVVKPAMTEGPYFVDEKLNRTDIRVDPSDNSVSPGALLHLKLLVSTIDARSCMPLKGAQVDVWHCDAAGVYSDTNDPNWGSTVGKKFLRGYQVTDSTGMVEFLTIYPGWYQGRAVHIHFKIRTDATSTSAYEFTSQFFFDDALTDVVQAQPPYASKGQRTLRNAQDGIYQGGGDQLTLAVEKADDGYTATFAIALDTSLPSPTAGPGGPGQPGGPRPGGTRPAGGPPGPSATTAPVVTPSATQAK
jgi:protocatechuate 3,4-dioxygenase beta subunit